MKTKVIKISLIYILLACLMISFSFTNAKIDLARAEINNDNVIIIETFKDFENISYTNKMSTDSYIGKEIRLYTDLYLKGKSLDLKGFKGVFIGNGHAIIGYNAIGGFFEGAIGEVKNLNFYDIESDNVKNSFGATTFSNIKIFGRENVQGTMENKIYTSTVNNIFEDLSSGATSASKVNDIFDIVLHINNHQSNADNFVNFKKDINFYNIDIKEYIDNKNLGYDFIINPSLDNDFIAFNTENQKVNYAEVLTTASITKSISLNGSGTKHDPYLVSSKEDIQFISEMTDTADLYFLQSDNINFRETNPSGGYIFNQASIKEFKGIYNGGGYAITNLTAPFIDSNNGQVFNLTVLGTNEDCIFIKENNSKGKISQIEMIYLNQSGKKNGYFIKSNVGEVAQVILRNYEEGVVFNDNNAGNMKLIDFGTVKITNQNFGKIDTVISNYSDNFPIGNNIDNGYFKLINNDKKEINITNEISSEFYSVFIVGEMVIAKGIDDKFILDFRLNKEIKINTNLKVDNTNKDKIFDENLEINLDYIKLIYTLHDPFFKDKDVKVSATKDGEIMEAGKIYYVGEYKVELSLEINSEEYTNVLVKRSFTVKNKNFELPNFAYSLQTYLNSQKCIYASNNYYNEINEYVKNEVIAILFYPGYILTDSDGLSIDFKVREGNTSHTEIINAGEYNLKLILAKANYNDYELNLTMKVDRAIIYFELADIPDIKFFEEHTFNFKTPIEGLITGDKLDTKGKMEFSTNRTKLSNVGEGKTYFCDLKISDANSLLMNSNYIAKVKGGRKYFNVIKNQIKIPNDIINDIEVTYNGLEQGFPSFSSKLAELEGSHGSKINFYDYQRVKDVKFVDNTVTAHEIEITFFANNYDDYKIIREIKIIPKDIQFFADNKETNYLDKLPLLTYSYTELADGDKNKTLSEVFEGSINLYCNYVEKVSNAGEYTIKIAYDNLYSKNYNILFPQNGKLSVKKIKFNFDINTIYKNFNNTEFEAKFITDRKDFTLSYYNGHISDITDETLISTPINAGLYTLKATFLENINYVESFKIFNITINKIDLILKITDGEKDYDGKAFTQTLQLPDGGDFVKLYTISPLVGDIIVQENLSLKDASSYEINLKIKDNNGNYNEYNKLFYYTINKKVLTVEGTEVFTFNGKAINFDYHIVSGLVENETVSIKASTAMPIEEIFKVGSYSVILSCIDNKNNYKILKDQRTIVIKEFQTELNLSNKLFEITYGDNISLNDKVQLILGDQEVEINLTYFSNAIAKAPIGSYNIINYRIDDLVYKGQIVFKLLSFENRLLIKPKEIIYDIFYQDKIEYNGEIMNNVVNCLNVEGLVYDDLLTFDYDYNRIPKDVGDYNVIITFDNKNYVTKDSLKVVSFSILKKSAVITYRDNSVEFYSDFPSLNFTFTGFLSMDNPLEVVSLENVSYNTAYSKGSDCGIYSVSLYKILDNIDLAKNYDITLVGGYITVTEREITNVSVEDVTVTYNGNAVTPKIKGKYDLYQVTYNKNPIDVGETNVEVTFAAKNFKTLILTATVIIEQAPITLQVIDLEIPYIKNSILKNEMIFGAAFFKSKEISGVFEFLNTDVKYGENLYTVRFTPSSQNFKVTEKDIKVFALIDSSLIYLSFLDGTYDEDEDLNFAPEFITILISDSIYDSNLQYYFDGVEVLLDVPFKINKSYDAAVLEYHYNGVKVGEVNLGKIVIDEKYGQEEKPIIPPADKEETNYTLILSIIGGVAALLIIFIVVALITKRRR